MHNNWIVAMVWCLLISASQGKATNIGNTDTLTAGEGPVRTILELTAPQSDLVLDGLQAGETYQLYWSPVSKTTCQIQLAGSSKPYHEFRALGATQQVPIQIEHCETAILVNVSLGCTTCPARNRTGRSLMGIVTEDNYTPEQLIRDVFIGGDCFDVDPTSIVATGDAGGRGYFHNGTSSVNIEEGVMLSTGSLENSAGGNEAYNTGNSFFVYDGDPDISQMVNSNFIYDKAALEFDFTPTTDSVSFEFVFASEEYCEYVNSSFNDAFGFFISGPGINGPFSNNAANIALVPGSSDNIAINSVNHLQNDNYYVNNIPVDQHDDIPNYLQCAGYPVNTNGVAITNIEFDGFTTVMTALAVVEPCETYHIKLVVADIADAYFDSAVFLKANSFSAGGRAEIAAEAPGETEPTNTAYEACYDAQFLFTRADVDWSEPLVVHYSLSPASTATPGVDYAALPDSIIIPAGDSVFYLPVQIFNDALVEGSESIILELDALCSCTAPFVELLIEDVPPLEVVTEDVFFCEPTDLILSPTFAGGIGTHTYLWNTGDTSPTLDLQAQSSAAYTVTVTDFCGNTATGTTQIEIVAPPTAVLSGYELVCPENPTASLQVDFTGAGPWEIVYSIDNQVQPPITGITDNPYTLEVATTGTYFLESVYANNCDGTVAGAATVAPVDWSLAAQTTPETCPNASDGTIDITVDGSLPPYSFSWDQGLPTIEDPTGLTSDTYQLTVTDFFGCTLSTTVTVDLAADVPVANAGLDKDLNCDLTTTTLEGSGSVGPQYTYVWNTIDGNILSGAQSLNPTVNGAGEYFLEITNQQTGCMVSDKTEVFIDTLTPLALIQLIDGPLVLNCIETSTVLSGTASQAAHPLEFLWSTLDGSLNPPENIPDTEVHTPGTYQLRVRDTENGCTASTAITIEADLDLPQINVQEPDLLTCRDSVLQLDGSNSSSGNTFTYNWNTTNGNIITGHSTLNPMVDQPGVYALTIYNTINNCENTDSILVEEDRETPIAEAGLTTELDCNTWEATLNGENSSEGPLLTYSWSTSNGNILTGGTTLTPLVNAAGNYWLTVLNMDNGCAAEDLVVVTQDEDVPNEADIRANPPECYGEGGSINILSVTGGEGPYLYSLDNGNHFYIDTLFWGLSPGSYQILIQDAEGCQYEESIIIPDVWPLTLTLEREVDINLGENYQIDAQVSIPDFQIDSIIWSPEEYLSCSDCLDPVVSVVEDTRFTLTVINDQGCEVSGDILLRVNRDRDVFIPNAFSPNEDGENDVVFINAREGVVEKVERFQIFSRWGEKVFEAIDTPANQPTFGWDGTLEGQRLNPGVFIYIADVAFIDGKTIRYTGDITITN